MAGNSRFSPSCLFELALDRYEVRLRGSDEGEKLWELLSG